MTDQKVQRHQLERSLHRVKQSWRAVCLRTQSKGISPTRKVRVETPWIWILTTLKVTWEEEQMHTWRAALQPPKRRQVTEVKLLRSYLL